MQSNGGQANRIRILSGCDFTAASYPIIVDSFATTTMTQGEGEYNDATATGTVALTQTQAMTSVMKLTGSLSGNLAYDLPVSVSGLNYIVDAGGVRSMVTRSASAHLAAP